MPVEYVESNTSVDLTGGTDADEDQSRFEEQKVLAHSSS